MDRRKAALGLTAGLLAFAAVAQERPSYGPDVTLEQAKQMAAAAQAESRKHNWRMAVAIVDNHGLLVYFERAEDTQTSAVDLAIAKAKTAAVFRRPSKAFEDGIAKGRVALLGLTAGAPGTIPIEGGLPIMINGRVSGGIGVSGANADEDAAAARAGLATLK